MRRVVPLLLLPAVLAACAGAPPPAVRDETATAHVRAWFPPHGIVHVITIATTYRLPLHAAVLIAPDGHATPANYINTEAAPSNAAGQWAAVNSWQNPVTGSDALAALTRNAAAGAAVRADTQILAVVSTADIALPDPVAYRRDWQRYRIRLSFGIPPGRVETEELAAPMPPSAAPSR
jgi:hypothetical protein